MRYFSAFTGIGGFDLATPENWECVGHSEIDKHANMVLKYRFPGVKNYGDIEKIRWEEVPDFDVLFGGTPCQDLSVAGKRTGLHGNKSRIFFEFVRVLKEKKPKYFIWENVKGALSSNAGWDFASVLLEFSEAGYSVWWQVLNATDFGIPQHRERVFVVGALGSQPPTEIFFEQKSNGKDNELQKQHVNTIRALYHHNTANGSYIVENQQYAQGQVPKIAIPVLTPGRIIKRQNGRRFKENDEPSFTLTVQDRHGIYDGYNIRYLTPLECERLMGLPDNWTKYGINDKNEVVEISDTHRYKLIGNAVVPIIVRNLIKLIEKKAKQLEEAIEK
jgi:DNA (cytosine-5)-methyltransferase 1